MWTCQDIGPEPDQIDIDRDLLEHRCGGRKVKDGVDGGPLIIGSDDQKAHLRCVVRLNDVRLVFGSVQEADIQRAVDAEGCPHLAWRLREYCGCGPRPGGPVWQADGHNENRPLPREEKA